MIYGSVCSGIEAATVAWHPLGWTPSFLSEIEKFPRAVLSHHYPTTPLHGDFTTIQKGDYSDIDLLVGGTPCQSFSVAGLRAGLADPRGNLMLEFGALAARLGPRWIVWENVPGVLSSNKGRDFGTFIGMLAELGYGFAYRVLDAQYFGVAQRRRRVFVVGYLGDWRRAAAVLFERDSLSGNPAPSREKGKEVAGTIAARSFAGGAGGRPEGAAGNHFIADVAPTLNAAFSNSMGLDNQHIDGGDCSMPQVAMCLNAGAMGRQDAESETLIPTTEGDFDVANTRPIAWTEELTASVDVAGTIQRGGAGGRHDGVAYPINTQIATRHKAMGEGTGFGIGEDGDSGYTLQAAHSHAVAFNANARPDELSLPDTSTLTCSQSAATLAGMQVRRLTPVECERLQGFPDGYTDIKPNGKSTPDGPRYKALGNSMAVPVMRWIGERIQEVEGAVK